MYQPLQEVIDKIDFESISPERKIVLKTMIDYIQAKKDAKEPILLHFICTHNSRRSQFAQVWSKVAATQYGLSVESYSGGVEETAFNKRAIESLERFGFRINKEGQINPRYFIKFDTGSAPVITYSKMFDDPINPGSGFAAIMTCADADENCPFVPGVELRIPLRYKDPKEYDDTPLEMSMYDYRSFQIATEMMYVFSKIK